MFIMTNNAKKTNKYIEEIDSILELKDETLKKLSETKDKDAIKSIHEELETLKEELSVIAHAIEEEDTNLNAELKKLTRSKGKKILVSYEINGEKLKAHINENNRSKFNNLVSQINEIKQAKAYYKENGQIDLTGIVSSYKIDEEAVAKMTDEEKVTYFNGLCASISNPKNVKNPAMSISTGNKFAIINAIDEEIFCECLDRYKEALLAVVTKENDRMRMNAIQSVLRQKIKKAPYIISSFKIDWDYVNKLESLEEKAKYFNELAIKIHKAPKGDNVVRIPLGESYVLVNKEDEMIFKQCFSEHHKVIKAIADAKKPSYTIDWDYVNSLDTPLKKANYFEDLCGKIDAVPKQTTVEIPFRKHTFIINRQDAEVFTTAMKEFENNYLEYMKEKREEEARKAEEARLAEEARILEEKRKEEEAKKAEEERIEKEKAKKEAKEKKAKELGRKRREEKRKAEEEKRKSEKEAKEKMLEVAKNAANVLNEQDAFAALEAKIIAEATRVSNNSLVPVNKDESLGLEELDKEEFQFLDKVDTAGFDDDLDEELVESIKIESSEDILASLNEEFDDSEVDLFEAYEETVEETYEEDDDELEYFEEGLNQSDESLTDIERTAKSLGGQVTETNGIQIIDLNDPKDKEEIDKDEDDNDKDNKNNKGGKFGSLKDFIKNKLSKKPKYDDEEDDYEEVASYEIPSKGEEIEIMENDAIKVLSSREFSGDVSESKFYIGMKTLYLNILDWITDQKINNRVSITTKSGTVEIDAKYEELYRKIANKYEALEERYERYANDKYHNLKIRLALSTPIVIGAVALFVTLMNKGAIRAEYDANSDILNSNNIEQTIDDNIKINDMTKMNETIIEDDGIEFTIEDYQEYLDEIKRRELEESEGADYTYEVDPLDYEGMTYPYSGSNVTEAFNADGGINLTGDDDEAKRQAEQNKTPLNQIVR